MWCQIVLSNDYDFAPDKRCGQRIVSELSGQLLSIYAMLLLAVLHLLAVIKVRLGVTRCTRHMSYWPV